VRKFAGVFEGYRRRGPYASAFDEMFENVSVGVGLDYADVTPLKGIYSGGGSTDLDVVVEITRLA